MKKLYRNKKALSTVISTILMILVVMIGMSVAFSYVVFYADGYKAGMGSSVLESLTIEDICLNSTGGTNPVYTNQATLWVYNSGQINANVTSIYINGTAATRNSSIDFNIGVPDVVVVNNHGVAITVNASSPWILGNRYVFTVITARGSHFESTPIPAT